MLWNIFFKKMNNKQDIYTFSTLDLLPILSYLHKLLYPNNQIHTQGVPKITDNA